MQKNEILIPDPIKYEAEITFKHSANIGDLIYSLCGIKAFCEKHNVKARILLGLNQKGEYYEGAVHPLGGYMFTKEMFDIAQPLLESQDYVSSVEVWEGQCKVAFDLDSIRTGNRPQLYGMPHSDIRQWIMMRFPQLSGHIGLPWIIRPKKTIEDYYVVNLTRRYRNPKINYEFMQDIDVPIFFIGVLEEYNLFIQDVPRAQYVKTKDYLQVANLISGSRLFIGNQSSCFAVAEAIGHPRILELCHAATNVTPATPNGTPFVDQKALEFLVCEA